MENTVKDDKQLSNKLNRKSSATGTFSHGVSAVIGQSLDAESNSNSHSNLSSIFALTTSKSLWKKPELHHEISQSTIDIDLLRKTEVENIKSRPSLRPENWHELFFDLLYVAAAAQISTVFQDQITVLNLIQSTFLFLILRSTWDHIVLYQNRFDTHDILHYTFYLLQAMCVFVMTLHLSVQESEYWNASINVRHFDSSSPF